MCLSCVPYPLTTPCTQSISAHHKARFTIVSTGMRSASLIFNILYLDLAFFLFPLVAVVLVVIPPPFFFTPFNCGEWETSDWFLG